jgi:thiamine-phosphate pyrophosphorylase
VKLVVISHSRHIENEATLITELFNHGLAYFHVRKPTWDRTRVAALLLHIPSRFHDRIVLHRHHDLIHEFGVKGIHLSARHDHTRTTYPDSIHTSVSTHRFDELRALPSGFDYAFLSPIFDSISKPGYRSPFEHAQLRTYLLSEQLPVPPIALGGITPKRTITAKQLGFHGVAVKGYIWNTYFETGCIDKTIQSFHRLQRSIEIT